MYVWMSCVRALHLACARVHLDMELKNDPYNFTLSSFVVSLSLLPHERLFFSLVEQTRGFSLRSYHFRTFSITAITRLMSSLALLRVSARTDLPDIPAARLYFLSSPAVHSHTMRAHALAYSERWAARWAGSAPAPYTKRADEQEFKLFCSSRPLSVV